MPTINQVIESYSEVEKLADAPLTIISEVLWTIVGLIFIVHLIRNRKCLSTQKFLFRGAFLLIILSIIGYLTYTLYSYDYSIDEESWKENTLAPYLQSLNEHHEQVDDFSQLLTEPDKGIESIYVKDITPIWVELVTSMDADKKGKVVEVTIEKEPIQEPYLTYKTIEKTISEQYSNQVYYETTLHIPEEYMILTD